MKHLIIIFQLLLFTSNLLIAQTYHDAQWVVSDTIYNKSNGRKVSVRWNDIRACNSANCMAIGNPNNVKFLIRRTTDEGKSWETVFADSSLVINGKLYPFMDLYDLDYPNKNLCVACGESPYIVRTSDNGGTWQKVLVTDTSQKLWSVKMKDEKNGLACNRTNIVVTNDGALTWQKVPLPIIDSVTVRPTRCQMLDEKNFVCISFYKVDYANGIYDYAICRTEDAGKHWSAFIFRDEPEKGEFYFDSLRSQYVSNCVNELNFTNKNEGLCIGHRTTEANNFIRKDIIYRTTDGGRTWQKVRNQFSESKKGLLSLSFYDELNGLLCGYDGEVLRTTDGGRTYIEESIDPNGKGVFFFSATMVSPVKAFGANRNGYIFKWLGPVVKGVEERDSKNVFSISPNPASNYFTINSKGQPAQYRIVNGLGEFVSSGVLSLNQTKISIENFSSGVYFVTVKTTNNVFTEKLMVH